MNSNITQPSRQVRKQVDCRFCFVESVADILRFHTIYQLVSYCFWQIPASPIQKRRITYRRKTRLRTFYLFSIKYLNNEPVGRLLLCQDLYLSLPLPGHRSLHHNSVSDHCTTAMVGFQSSNPTQRNLSGIVCDDSAGIVSTGTFIWSGQDDDPARSTTIQSWLRVPLNSGNWKFLSKTTFQKCSSFHQLNKWWKRFLFKKIHFWEI